MLSRFRLCDTVDHSPSVSSVHGIFQVRILEWVAILSPGDLPNPGIEPSSLKSPALAGGFFTTWKREWQPTSIFLPGEFHGQRRLAGCSPWGCKELDMTEQLILFFTTTTSWESHPESSYFSESGSDFSMNARCININLRSKAAPRKRASNEVGGYSRKSPVPCGLKNPSNEGQ